MKAILATNHEWVQALPLLSNTVVCTRCQLRTAIGQKAAHSCRPHLEMLGSGFEGRVVDTVIASASASRPR